MTVHVSKRGSNELTEKLDLIDMEDFLTWMNVDFRVTTGSSGTQLNLRECPRCGGTGWKVYLNAETGLGTCFHGDCVGEPGFNKFSYIRHLEGDNARQAGKVIDNYVRDIGWRPRRAKVRIQVEQPSVELPTYEKIVEGTEAYDYLARRGFDQATIDHYGWVYCREGYWRYTDAKGLYAIQRYNGRILIPVVDEEGSLVTFQGRDITGTKENKYLFPPGLPGTGRFLYNAHNAFGCKTAVLGEGVFDVVAIAQALEEDPQYRNVAVMGTFGKSLSKGSDELGQDQLGTLLRLQKGGLHRVVFMWDGERKTIVDACAAALDLKRYGFDTRLAYLPKDKDPNEVEPYVIREAMRTAQPVTRALLTVLRLRGPLN